MTADTLLAAIDDETPISGDDFAQRITHFTKVNLCDLSYKGRHEEAADQLWTFVDEIDDVIGVDDAVQTALTLLDVASQSGRLDDQQEKELADLRAWIEAEGSMFNFKRALK